MEVTSKSLLTNPALQRTGALIKRLLLSEYFVLYLIIVYFLFLVPFLPTLSRPQNLSNLLSNTWPLLAVAIGQTFVLIFAGIDLSQGSIMALTSVVGASIFATAASEDVLFKSPLWGTIITEEGGLLSNHPNAVLIGILVMFIVGVMIGFFNGVAIARFNMPPFMVTLVSLIFFSAVAIYLTQSENIRDLPEDYLRLGQGDIISIYIGEKTESQIPRRDIYSLVTYPMLIALGLAGVSHFILNRTKFGRYVYAIGINRRAAEISGVPTRSVIILIYMWSGFCATVGAILFSARLEAGRPTLGAGTFLLDVIGATVIGGTSLFGGKGKITWTIFGVLFFVLLSNTLNLMNLSAFQIDMVKGAVILAAAALDVTRTRLLKRERAA
ncbi:MAG: ABC transporter permease [Anaerolineae bacterium]